MSDQIKEYSFRALVAHVYNPNYSGCRGLRSEDSLGK
jgi:hypothetical protein